MVKPRGPSIKTTKIFEKHKYTLTSNDKARHDALRSAANRDSKKISELYIGLVRMQSLYDEQEPEYTILNQDKKYLHHLDKRYREKWIG
jgi:hypothetical protein